jgi:cytochrome P450
MELQTVVQTTLYHAHTNSKYFPDPFKFKPERWISKEQNELEHNDLEAFFPFSAGTRNCIGKNFALQEMRICLSTFLKHFEIAPIEQEMKDAEEIRTFITMTIVKNSFKIRIKRRSRA